MGQEDEQDTPADSLHGLQTVENLDSKEEKNMTIVPTCYPNIAKAALEMSYDNGGIHRERTEEDVLRALAPVLKDYEAPGLVALDAWIGTLSEEDLSTLVAGEQTDMLELQKKAPDHVLCGRLMEDIFEKAA